MARSSNILHLTEYIKDVLYFAVVKEGTILKDSRDSYYFSIDSELIYINFYSDFGPLNIGNVYKYCRILNDKLANYLHKQKIIHYTSSNPAKKANAAFLLGCYGVLYLGLPPKEAYRPLIAHGLSYRPFQDASHADSKYKITILDCLNAIAKAHRFNFFNFQDFNFEEYEKLDKIYIGDLNWIVPGKFLAFIGPISKSLPSCHPPEKYINYFIDNNVKVVIRLNKRQYDGNVFKANGIDHYDLFFPDGTCPPYQILLKFLQIAEQVDGAIAVHCKAGLGRTGSLIGSYLIKHYRMTANEAIAWMRICRPGSVIGEQQEWLQQLEAWLLKQGHLYRIRVYQDSNHLPMHKYGIYSIAQKLSKSQRQYVLPKHHNMPLLPPCITRRPRFESTSPIRPLASKYREAMQLEIEQEKGSTTFPVRTVKKMEQASVSRRSAKKTQNPASGEPLLQQRSANKNSKSTYSTMKADKTSFSGNDFVDKFSQLDVNTAPVNRQRNNNCTKGVNTLIQVTNFEKIRTVSTGSDAYYIEPNIFKQDSRGYGKSFTKQRRLGRSPSPPSKTERYRNPTSEEWRDYDNPSCNKQTIVREENKNSLSYTTKKTNDYCVESQRSKAMPSLQSPEDCRSGNATSRRRGHASPLEQSKPCPSSVGVSSLGARRVAPLDSAFGHSTSARSDECPLATQGDLLNSIKFRHRLKEQVRNKTFNKSCD